MKRVSIMALDPSTTCTGWALVESDGNLAYLIDYGEVEPAGATEIARLCNLDHKLRQVFKRVKFDEGAVEAGFVSSNKGRQQEGGFWNGNLAVAEARGICIAALNTRALFVVKYPPNTVKKVTSGDGVASKEKVARFVELHYRLPGPLPLDASDAAAVAYTHHMRRKQS